MMIEWLSLLKLTLHSRFNDRFFKEDADWYTHIVLALQREVNTRGAREDSITSPASLPAFRFRDARIPSGYLSY